MYPFDKKIIDVSIKTLTSSELEEGSTLVSLEGIVQYCGSCINLMMGVGTLIVLVVEGD